MHIHLKLSFLYIKHQNMYILLLFSWKKARKIGYKTITMNTWIHQNIWLSDENKKASFVLPVKTASFFIKILWNFSFISEAIHSYFTRNLSFVNTKAVFLIIFFLSFLFTLLIFNFLKKAFHKALSSIWPVFIFCSWLCRAMPSVHSLFPPLRL